MSRPQTEQVIALSIRPSGENFYRLQVLGQDSGLFSCLKRSSARKSSDCPIDHFDSIELSTEAARSGGNTRFVKEHTTLKQRRGIGQSYTALQAAADYAKLLLNNATHLPDPKALYSLCERTLDAFDTGKAPPVVYLKGLFLFLQSEGYPIRESWWPQLPVEHRTLAKTLLNQPSPLAAAFKHRNECNQLNIHLQNWVRRNTELHI